ncbi:MAG: efflux RND transporter periplasmic adaptor subunit [Thermodesulfobacteriota bacterium]|nr:efflux RND transporter periplasmic adaptor subunit [Thermodesulfobacteriota bacterium]
MIRNPARIKIVKNRYPDGWFEMKKITTTTMIMVSLGLFLAISIPCNTIAAPPKKSSPPPLVTITTVIEQDVTPLKEYVGHVEAIQTVALQARVSGFLEQIHFKEGSNVSAGDLLYVVEPAPYQMKVAVNRARVAKAQAVVNETSQRLKRIQNVRAGGIPITDIEAAVATELQAQAELQEALAVLNLSEIDLNYTQILAPISGRIGVTTLSIGNLCGPTSGPLAQIVQLDPIRVRFSISENDIKAVKAAQDDAESKKNNGTMQPRLKLSDGKFLKNVGRIDFVDTRVDPTTGTIAVRALFANPEELLLPGQYVRLVASQSREKKLPVIPQVAVLEDRDGRYLLLVDGESKVVQRRITTGAAIGSLWAVETGLSAGEKAIVQGLQKVRPGQTVKTTTVAEEQGN